MATMVLMAFVASIVKTADQLGDVCGEVGGGEIEIGEVETGGVVGRKRRSKMSI
jgi:hypothetical protein